VTLLAAVQIPSETVSVINCAPARSRPGQVYVVSGDVGVAKTLALAVQAYVSATGALASGRTARTAIGWPMRAVEGDAVKTTAGQSSRPSVICAVPKPASGASRPG
jgi:hypothetical protein